MSQNIPEAEEHEKMAANKFGVTTQGTHVVTQTRLLYQNSVMTLSQSVTTKKIKKEVRDQVATKNKRI